MEAQFQSNPSAENEAFWKSHLEQQKASGLTRAKYCRSAGINYDRFGYWIHKWSKQTGSLVAVKLKTSTESSFPTTLCKLHFRNGCDLTIHDVQTLSFILDKMI